MLQKERNADEAVGKQSWKIISTKEEGVLPLQIATEFMKYIPARFHTSD
jgi:hypothetical protein